MPNNSTLYSSSNNRETLRLSMDSDEEINQQIPKKSSQTNNGYMTRSKKANLIFSVSRVENHLRKGRYAERLSQTTSVYLASVLEYLVAEMLELAGEITHKSKRKRITPRHIALAIKNDEELAKLCAHVTIPEGGVQPHIHQVLLKTNKRRRKRRVTFSVNSSLTQSNNNISLSTDIDGNLSSDSDLQME